MTFDKTQNTRQQDFLLVAKGHYKCPQEELPASITGLTKPSQNKALVDDRIEIARKICHYHNGCTTMKLIDTANCLLKDFVAERVILTDPVILSGFLFKLGPHAPIDILNRYTDQPGGYYGGLIAALMDEISVLQVYRDGQVLIPFPVPSVDAKLQEFLNQM
jgi:hypothetical protein